MKKNKIFILFISLSIILYVILKFQGFDNLFMQIWSCINILLILINSENIFKITESKMRLFKCFIIVLLILKIIAIIEYIIITF